MEGMLEKLDSLRDQKVEIHLKNGVKMRCIPQQYLEEDYDSYLVDTYESYGGYPARMLVELVENEIVKVIRM